MDPWDSYNHRRDFVDQDSIYQSGEPSFLEQREDAPPGGANASWCKGQWLVTATVNEYTGLIGRRLGRLYDPWLRNPLTTPKDKRSHVISLKSIVRSYRLIPSLSYGTAAKFWTDVPISLIEAFWRERWTNFQSSQSKTYSILFTWAMLWVQNLSRTMTIRFPKGVTRDHRMTTCQTCIYFSRSAFRFLTLAPMQDTSSSSWLKLL